MTRKMNAQEIDTVEKALRRLESLLVGLYQRWQDEKDYEDFKHYNRIFKERSQEVEGVTFVKANQRPFGVTFKLNSEVTVKLFVNSTSIGWKRVKG